MEMGRPSIFTQDLADKICLAIAEGNSLRSVCAREGFPVVSTVLKWVLEADKAAFSEQYRHARAAQAEHMFDEILDIADDGSNDFMTITKGEETYNVEDREVTNRSKLRVNARQWYLSKVLPKKFGDRTDITSGGEPIKSNTIVIKNFKEEQDNG